MRTRLIFFIVAVLSLTIFPTSLTSNAAPNSIEIISIAEVSCTSVEILFDSNVPKKSLSYYVISAVVDDSVVIPKNIKKVIKTKATGLITAEIKNLNPKAIYNFSVSAKTNKGKMISSKVVKYSSVCNLMDLLSNLPADWGNPKPIQLPTPAPTTPPIAIPAFTLSSATETRTVNTAATGFTINSTGGAIASFAINATPPNMSFNTTSGALTGTPNTVAAATNYTITATNATGSATQTFTLTVTVGAALKVAVTQASVGLSPGIAFTTQPQITIQDSGGNTITTSTAVVTATVSTGGTLVGTATATASSGVATFNNLGIRGYGGTAYTITYTAAGLTTATQSITPAALIVGNTGPGGGKIFYVATSTGFNCGPTTTEKCYYLEAAPSGPSGWNTGADPSLSWATNVNNNRTTTVPAPGAIQTAIGTGYQNSDAIVAQTGNVAASSAAVAARAYRGNGLTDWFLSSKDELNLLYLQRAVVGGLKGDYYWSSSETSAIGAWVQYFDHGATGSTGKDGIWYVRPVRAF
jgi:hypothetical protein